MYDSFVRLSEKITKASGGRLVATPYPAGSVVPATKEFDAVNSGVLDYGQNGTVFWRDKFPNANLFLFTVAGLSPVEGAYWMSTGGGMQLLEKMIAGYNVKVFLSQIRSAEIFLQSSKPVKSLADMKGLKIRTAGDDEVPFTKMGATCINVAPAEIYEAMQRGVIDAFQMSSPSADWSFGTQEIAKYIYLSGVRQPAEMNFMMINASRWAELSPDLQEIVEAEANQSAWYHYGKVLNLDVEAVQKYKDYGCVVEDIPKDIENEMVKQAQIFYADKAAKDPFAAEVLASIQAFQDKIRNNFQRL